MTQKHPAVSPKFLKLLMYNMLGGSQGLLYSYPTLPRDEQLTFQSRPPDPKAETLLMFPSGNPGTRVQFRP